jgi:hypothetical protein
MQSSALPFAILTAVLTFAVPLPMTSQVVARQGTAGEAPQQEFKSPMILDLPFNDFKDVPFGTGKDFRAVQKFYCDDLAISQLLVTKKEESHRGKPSSWRLARCRGRQEGGFLDPAAPQAGRRRAPLRGRRAGSPARDGDRSRQQLKSLPGAQRPRLLAAGPPGLRACLKTHRESPTRDVPPFLGLRRFS